MKTTFSLALTEAKLVQESKYKLTVLQDMLRINVVDGIIGCVNVGVAVLKCSFEDERSWVTIPCSRAMV
jgi:hypothetical protein